MATTGSTAALPFRIAPLNNIAGATYRDGASHMQILEKLRVYVNDVLRMEFNEGLEWLVTELNKGIANAETVVLEAKDGWETVFANYMVDVNASLMALNDHAMATLIDDPATETGTALVNGFVQRGTVALEYFVNPVTGSDDNDGSSTAPFATVGCAVRLIEETADLSNVGATITLAGGTYKERVVFKDFTPFNIKVKIRGQDVGGHPATPTTIFTEGVGTAANAILSRNHALTLTVQDVKFIGYNGSASSCGINSNNGNLYTINCHFELCFYGASSFHGTLDVKGGVYDNNGRLNGTNGGSGGGIRSMMQNRHSIGVQSAGTLTNGPIFRNNRYGVVTQESSTGHVDWCTFEDNESAVVVRVMSRANIDGCNFKRSLTDVTIDSNGHVFIPETVKFGTGADKSQQTVVATNGGQYLTERAISGVSSNIARSETVAYGKYVPTLVQETTNVKLVDRMLLAPWWNDTPRSTSNIPKILKFRTFGTITGELGTKAIQMSVGDGGTASFNIAATNTGRFELVGECRFLEAGKQHITLSLATHLGSRQLAGFDRAVDMSVDQPFTVTANVSNIADSITFDWHEIITN